MEQYDKYINTGINWIGEIPSHWGFRRMKYEVDYTKGRNPKELTFDEKGKPYLSMEYLRGNPKQTFYVEDFENFLNVNENEILLLWDGSNAGEFIKSKEGVLSSTMAALNIHSNNPNYAWYFFKTFEINLRESTIGMGIPHVNGEEFKNQIFIIPPPKEQTAIANYLNKKTIEVDNLISHKQKLIEILKEERIAITNTAVTKGLNAKVKMKPSGVEWIGDIPEHWKITRVKYVCTVQGRIGFKGYKSSDLVNESEGALVLGATHITRDHKIDITEPVFLSWEKYYESPEIMVKQGDVVFTQRGVYLGKVALIDRDYKDVTINPSLILLKENLINSGYVTFYLTSHYIRKTIELISSNTAIPMISQENLSNFYCLVPPDKEQEEIFDFVNKSNSKIDLTISQIEKEIELMHEYRTALISEVVTGKIKVPA
jgi:type I restriction enzyme S subunit